MGERAVTSLDKSQQARKSGTGPRRALPVAVQSDEADEPDDRDDEADDDSEEAE